MIKKKNQMFSVVVLLLCLIQTTVTDNSYEGFGLDNRKPQIKNCKGYAPVVKEEQPIGTFVVKIEASDMDKNDRINFSFITASDERSKFKIDSSTGIITTAHSFDRDEPAREKEVYVTVKATDNGRPALDDVCTFKVTIEDINDNAPVFDKAKYIELMPEDRQVNKVVTRISATDLDDGDNSIVYYEIIETKHYKYFRIDENSGVIYLQQSIDKKPGQFYSITVRAYNKFPDRSQQSETEVRIEVIESNKKAPTFIDPPNDPVILKENFNNFDKPLVTLSAISNVPEKPDLIFELVTGRTEQTNIKKTFVLIQNGNDASILLGKPLDYEAITDYLLTVTVRNSYDIITDHIIKIKVEDVNDNIPSFVEIDSGKILENEPPGTVVMQIRAIDSDTTPPFNTITFELADNTEFFAIDSSGIVTSKVSFDREERDFYNVIITATDGAPSSLFKAGKHNSAKQVFRIDIADKNDHKPKFTQDQYLAERLSEDANLNTIVIEVLAVDRDTASSIEYSIEEGNIDEAFKIEPTTGKITVNRPLDYEQTTEYKLKIKAFDGIYSDYAIVNIQIADVNDCPPIFLEDEYQNEIQEEQIHPYCIVTMDAYDPDIRDRSLPQRIKYEISKKEQRDLLTIDEYGCLRNIKPLDRDKPNGQKSWQILVSAIDEDGLGLEITKPVTIILIDINDNAPFLNMTTPIVWMENYEPGYITKLEADDYDELSTNGYQFHYQLDDSASNDIRNKFDIKGNQLEALVKFDREEQKEYSIPIKISDSGTPMMSNVSYLTIIIGDVNDNAMEEGSSNIFVYNYKGQAPSTEIGRVYVNDKDDWDLPDKQFYWKGAPDQQFSLNKDTGMITMLTGTQDDVYELHFKVTEQSDFIPYHEVSATVAVTIKVIPEIAVDKSGSIRFYDITAERFIEERPDDPSPKEKLRVELAELYNTSVSNVDIFTVLKNYQDSGVLDVRFSAHGSPYYEPERLNGLIAQHQHPLEQKLGLKMLMINIDECLIERAKCEKSCINVLEKSDDPIAVFSNQTSFVGVNAFVTTRCECREPSRSEPVCLNGGTPYANRCECPPKYEGPNCEQLSVGFSSDGWAMYPPLDPCEQTQISLEIKPQTQSALVMYIGPLNYNARLPVQDFLAFEIDDGYPVLTVDYGTGSTRIMHNHSKLEIGKSYTIEITLATNGIELTVDHCKLSSCMVLGAPQGKNEFLNVNSPIHLGGSSVNLKDLATQFNWTHTPSTTGYRGCIRNLTINHQTYNLGQPSLFRNVDPGCDKVLVEAVTFGVASNFLYAIIACIILLLILILAVVVHKKSYDGVSLLFRTRKLL